MILKKGLFNYSITQRSHGTRYFLNPEKGPLISSLSRLQPNDLQSTIAIPAIKLISKLTQH